MNSFLVSINEAILIRDMSAMRKAAQELKTYLDNGGESPSWGWNGFITKKFFEAILSKCPKCEQCVSIVSKGIFGYEALCSKCSSDPSNTIVGAGNEIEEAIADWIQRAMTK